MPHVLSVQQVHRRGGKDEAMKLTREELYAQVWAEPMQKGRCKTRYLRRLPRPGLHATQSAASPARVLGAARSRGEATSTPTSTAGWRRCARMRPRRWIRPANAA